MEDHLEHDEDKEDHGQGQAEPLRVRVPQRLPANQVHMSSRYPRQRWDGGEQGKRRERWGVLGDEAENAGG